MLTTLLRLHSVLLRTGRSKSSLYADISAGLFVMPVKIGAQAVAWPEYEVEAIIQARIAGKTEPDIRNLVIRLTSQRMDG